MIKAKHIVLNGDNEQVWIYCPGCNTHHAFTVKHPGPFRPWTWNGSVEKPSFSPSMLVNQHDPKTRCHSWVTEGKIQFLSDCHHNLKNTSVELPEID